MIQESRLPLLVFLLAGCASAPVSDPLAGAFAGADTLDTAEVAPGVRHVYAWEARGPWAIHVAEVDLGPCTGVEARHAGPPLTRTATTSAIAGGGIAAVNADFFALPEGTPVGVQVSGGEVLVAPGRWQAVGFRGQERDIGSAELSGALRSGRGERRIATVNRAPAAEASDEVRLYTRWMGEEIVLDSGWMAIVASVIPGSDESSRAVVDTTAEGPTAAPIPEDGVVLAGRRGALPTLTSGDTIEWSAQIRLGDADFTPTEVLGGFPVLLRDGRVPPELATEPRPSFGQQRHPRTAVGWSPAGPVLLVTVDGRQAPYSDGMTLAELAELMGRLGATEALNLDGGGSTTMVIGGRVVNRTSDASGERPVGNALVVVRTCE